MEFGKFHYITLSSLRPGSRTGSRAGLRRALAKFHYSIQVTDLVSDLSQTGLSYLDMSR